MSIEIIHNKEPVLRRPTFLVDGELDERLNEFEITKLLNRSNFTLFLGKAGSGKTSMIVSLLNSPNLFKKVFHTIYLFMGKNSRDSIKGSFFDKQIPKDQIYDELNMLSWSNMMERVKQDAEDGYKSLVILDDVQRDLKGEVQKDLLHAVSNRRHLKLSVWCANQNYINLPRSVRMGLTDIFVWKVNKREMENIFTEQIEQHKAKFDDVLKLLFANPHDFMYINTNSQRLFNNWDEIVIKE